MTNNEKVNHNCTTTKMAEQLDVPLWKVMELGRYFKSKHHKVDEGKLEHFIFTFLYERKLSETYRYKCKCIDGCSHCDGTGYILNKLGIALIDLAHTIAQEAKEWIT